MSRRYLVFDVETPNEKAGSMCAVGISCLDEVAPGEFLITEDAYTLIDPDDYFNPFNISIHGIREEDILYAPKFPEAWSEFFLPRITDDTVLVAHNAAFDIRVLKNCMRIHKMRTNLNRYICTVQMGRKIMPFAPNHKLNTLAEILKIELDHHNAASDANCAALLLKHYIEVGADPELFIKHFEIV